MQKKPESSADPSRREFLKTSSAVASVAALAPRGFHPGGRAELKVGLVGCGGRGTGAAANCIESSEGVKIWAMGDAFEDRLRGAHGELMKRGDRVDVPKERQFVGLDAYQKVLATDIDIVILATPPGFRPLHIEAAIAAGKNVFAEKPCAVDPTGIRRVIAAGEEAKKKGLAFVAGTQRRHEDSYLNVIQRIQDGAIGEPVGGYCYWNQGVLWVHKRKPEYTDVEWQIRNWLYFAFLSGDHIVEQHVHNLDVMNWIMGTHPVKVMGMGGRQARTHPDYGHIYDHFALELEYPDGRKVTSMCRQTPDAQNRVGEYVIGTKGFADPGRWIKGNENYTYRRRDARSPYVQEHADLIASIRNGTPLNEAQNVAWATMVAIMGRMSAYTGKLIEWDWAMNESKLDLMPEDLAFGPKPVDPVAIPGQTPLI